MSGEDLRAYYSLRAAEYDAIYDRPERQEDLALLRALLPPFFIGRELLELACGTGYWTETVASTARSVLSADLSAEVLARARRRGLPPGRVRFVKGDAYRPEAIPGRFDAAFAGFWWSHVPKGKLSSFLSSLHRRLEPGSRVVFLDNLYVEGSSTPLCGQDEEGNTYQERRLTDGSLHRVLKNFPGESEIREAVAGDASSMELRLLTYFWLLSYRLPASR